MNEDYLRNIRHWLRTDLPFPPKELDPVRDAGDPEVSPLIPSPRTSLE